MYIILRLLSLSSVFVGFGEGVCFADNKLAPVMKYSHKVYRNSRQRQLWKLREKKPRTKQVELFYCIAGDI
jgi:hypothetical protein